ncbi:MAG: MBOAT family O-acyltransferase [Candidatus Vecturithrix sp.]|nr:MBOAT family O-acyltransferase [Candidatus Vecturithrix sp.]
MKLYPRYKTSFLITSVLGNVGSLAVFKYSGFIADNLTILLAMFDIEINLRSHLPNFMLILPVGISFYTFQSMSYTIDIYREQLQPTTNVFHFFAYLSLFPQLVAGPIIRASDLLPQLTQVHKPDEEERWEGLKLIAHGFFKKVVIADNLAPSVNYAFGNPIQSTSSLYWWIAVTGFAFQIYCDFSGYSDIARGLAKWMGYDFMLNFDHPYISTSLREFWSRWHISLSTWFRDYVYIPLGGSRKGTFHTYLNMFITMTVSGLWHGAAWNFVIWGFLHALLVNLERLTQWPSRLKNVPGGRWIATGIVLFEVWVTWVFFRARTFAQALYIIKTMFSFSGGLEYHFSALGLGLLLIAILRELYFYLRLDQKILIPFAYEYSEVLSQSVLLVACIYLRGPGSAFIYFQF